MLATFLKASLAYYTQSILLLKLMDKNSFTCLHIHPMTSMQSWWLQWFLTLVQCYPWLTHVIIQFVGQITLHWLMIIIINTPTTAPHSDISIIFKDETMTLSHDDTKDSMAELGSLSEAWHCPEMIISQLSPLWWCDASWVWSEYLCQYESIDHLLIVINNRSTGLLQSSLHINNIQHDIWYDNTALSANSNIWF